MEIDPKYLGSVLYNLPKSVIEFIKDFNDTLKEFFSSEDHIYTNDDLKITFKKANESYPLVSVIHEGWHRPSMYNDTPPDHGSCNIRFSILENKIVILFIFESDDYSRS